MSRPGQPADSSATWADDHGLPPPLQARTPLLFALVGGVLLTAAVLLLVRLPGPLDEHSLADQRNGLVAAGPRVAPQVAGVAFGGRTVALLFQRQAPDPAAVGSWRAQLPDGLTVRVVVQQPGQDPPRELAGVPVIVDPGRRLAAAVALPPSRDGGPGVGYAVVDAGRTTRYATLDPSWESNGFEMATIIGATR